MGEKAGEILLDGDSLEVIETSTGRVVGQFRRESGVYVFEVRIPLTEVVTRGLCTIFRALSYESAYAPRVTAPQTGVS